MRRVLPFAGLLLAMCAAAARANDPVARTTVFFGSWSALIEPSARESIAIAAAAAKLNPAATVSVTGYASTVGSIEANNLLSQLRARVVADALVADGVAESRIQLAAPGPTSFVLDPLEARRVIIEVDRD